MNSNDDDDLMKDWQAALLGAAISLLMVWLLVA